MDGARDLVSEVDAVHNDAMATIDAALRAFNDLFPPGIALAFSGSVVPGGWLLANGATVSRTTYAALFAAIGTTHGAGDGSTTFNLPDYQGRVLIGAGSGAGLTARALGQKGGVELQALTVAQMPWHNHGAAASVSGWHNHGGATHGADMTHAHTSQDGRPFLTDRAGVGGGVYNLSGGASVGNGGGGWTANANPVHAHGISADGVHAHDVTVHHAGEGATHNNMQPFAVANYIIKAV